MLFLLCSVFVKAQQRGGMVVFGTIYKGDTIPMMYLDAVCVRAYVSPLTEEEKRKYRKLIRNVKIVYPYAKQAGVLLDRYNIVLAQAKNDSQRKKIICILLEQKEYDLFLFEIYKSAKITLDFHFKICNYSRKCSSRYPYSQSR